MSRAVSSPAKGGRSSIWRGADDQSTGRGVLDTRFRGYDGRAYDERDLFAPASAAKPSSFVLRITMVCFGALAMRLKQFAAGRAWVRQCARKTLEPVARRGTSAPLKHARKHLDRPCQWVSLLSNRLTRN